MTNGDAGHGAVCMDASASGKIEKGVDKNIDESYHLILQPIPILKPVSIFGDARSSSARKMGGRGDERKWKG